MSNNIEQRDHDISEGAKTRPMDAIIARLSLMQLAKTGSAQEINLDSQEPTGQFDATGHYYGQLPATALPHIQHVVCRLVAAIVEARAWSDEVGDAACLHATVLPTRPALLHDDNVIAEASLVLALLNYQNA